MDFAKGCNGKAYWFLMTKDVVPGSRSKAYRAQQALVASHARLRQGIPIKCPISLEGAAE